MKSLIISLVVNASLIIFNSNLNFLNANKNIEDHLKLYINDSSMKQLREIKIIKNIKIAEF